MVNDDKRQLPLNSGRKDCLHLISVSISLTHARTHARTRTQSKARVTRGPWKTSGAAVNSLMLQRSDWVFVPSPRALPRVRER